MKNRDPLRSLFFLPKAYHKLHHQVQGSPRCPPTIPLPNTQIEHSQSTKTDTHTNHASTRTHARAHNTHLFLALSLSTSVTREIKVSRSRKHQVAPNHENENCFCEEKLFKEVENCATIGGQGCAGDKRRRRIPIKWETRNTQESQGFLALPTVEQQQEQELSVNQQLVA